MGTAKRERQKAARQARLEALQVAEKKRRSQRTLVRAGLFIGAIVLLALALAFLLPDDDDDEVAATATTAAPTEAPAEPTECPPAEGAPEPRTTFSEPFPECIDPARTYTATVETSKGDFTIALDDERAPLAVNNFVSLARSRAYEGVVFHRIIPGFVVQGGRVEGRESIGYTFADELPEAGEYEVGSVAMANSGPDTNGSQFFVVTGDQGVALDPLYTLFGSVTEGMDVVMAIEAVGSPGGEPGEEVVIERVTISES